MTDYFKHIDMINNPTRWPNEPFLPLCKNNGDNRPRFQWPHGVIHVNNRTTIKAANLFMLPDTKEAFDALDGWTYNSIEELVADGWEVD